jgi:hypothetical protein
LTELDPDAADLARRQDVERRAGGSLSADAVGRLLGITREAVDERRRAKTLLAIRRDHEWVYPRAQFHGTGTIPYLVEVIQGLIDPALIILNHAA